MSEINFSKWSIPNPRIWAYLRVVQTQAILFLKSMSKGVGSDIEWLRNWISRSTQNLLKMIFIQILSRSTMKNHFKIKLLESELPLTGPYLLPVKVRGALSFFLSKGRLSFSLQILSFMNFHLERLIQADFNCLDKPVMSWNWLYAVKNSTSKWKGRAPRTLTWRKNVR